MKKLFFIFFCLAVTTAVNAQSRVDQYAQPMLTVHQDDPIIEQQFIREQNGIKYRIVIEEHPINPAKNTVFIYRYRPQEPVSFLRLALAPKFENFRVMPVDGISNKFVILYSFNGAEKVIEFD